MNKSIEETSLQSRRIPGTGDWKRKGCLQSQVAQPVSFSPLWGSYSLSVGADIAGSYPSADFYLFSLQTTTFVWGQQSPS